MDQPDKNVRGDKLKIDTFYRVMKETMYRIDQTNETKFE